MTTDFPTTTPAEAIERIRTKLIKEACEPKPAYAMIVGAGFSHPVIPLTKELLQQRIGDNYFLNDGESIERTPSQKRRDSAGFWKEFNDAAGSESELPRVNLDKNGLPANPSAAYQNLFDYRRANELFSPSSHESERSWVARLQASRYRAQLKASSGKKPRASPRGKKFVDDLLQNEVDPGGRPSINGAHFFLASLLELQQTGKLFKLRPFCRTILTTNFDTVLQDALQLVNVLYTVADRPERGLDASDFPEDHPAIHLVYTHGTILRRNPASSEAEIRRLSKKNAKPLAHYLKGRDVLVVGYGGWDDSLMSALKALSRCDATHHRIYWCDVCSADKLRKEVAKLLQTYKGRAVYVPLGSEGADGFMARLYQALSPTGGVPSLLRDPIGAYQARLRRLTLGALSLTVPENQSATTSLPLPRLEAAAARIHGTACQVLARFCPRPERDLEVQVSPAEIARQLKDRVEAQARALVDEAFARALSGQSDQAVEMWSRVVESGSAPSYERAQAANYIGVVHARASRNDLAISAYTRALELDSSTPYLRVAALTNRGAAYREKGQIDEALEDFSRVIQICESEHYAGSATQLARALIYRGVTHKKEGDTSLAEDDFRRARELKDIPPECAALLPATVTRSEGQSAQPKAPAPGRSPNQS